MIKQAKGRAGLVLTFAFFVLLGVPEGALGAAWPTMRESFGQPVSSLAWLGALYTVGYLLSTVVSGHLTERIGVSRTLRSGVGMTVIGVGLYAVSPWWWLVIMASMATGLGGGTVDAAGNSYCAVVGGVRSMNLLHAMFGVGATAGPLLVTLSLDLGGGWRSVYAALAVVQLVLLGLATRYRDEFRVPFSEHAAVANRRPMPRRLLWLMLAVFFFYVSSEAAYGQWSFSVLTEDRGVDTTLAGWALAGYWGGLTLGRFLLSYLGDRVEPMRLLHVSLVSIVVAAIAFWVDPLPGLDLVALPVLGFSMAGVFPALVLVTPAWLGPGNTGRAVGYQLGASSLGVISMSGLIGVVVGQRGLDAMPFVVALLTIGTLVSFQLARIEARSGIEVPTVLG